MITPNMSTSTRGKGGHSCAAIYCRNNRMQCKTSYFSFPKDAERYFTLNIFMNNNLLFNYHTIYRARKWVMQCKRNDLLQKTPEELHRGYRVCGVHFQDKMFLNDLKNRLQPHAVPTMFPNQPCSPCLTNTVNEGNALAWVLA